MLRNTTTGAMRLTRELEANIIRISHNFFTEQNIREAREKLKLIDLELRELESVPIRNDDKLRSRFIKLNSTFH